MIWNSNDISFLCGHVFCLVFDSQTASNSEPACVNRGIVAGASGPMWDRGDFRQDFSRSRRAINEQNIESKSASWVTCE